MAARVSAEAAGPSYASVLNFRGVECNKENIEAPAEEEVDSPPKQQEDEEEEGFVPVMAHGRSKGKGRRERDRRGGPPRPHKTPAQHPDAPTQTAEQQQQSSETQPKKFVEAPIPKVNPWQVRGGSTGVPPPQPPALEEKRSPLQPQQQPQQQVRPQPVPEPPAAPALKPALVKAPKTAKVNAKVGIF